MRPSNNGASYILDKPREIAAIEAGAVRQEGQLPAGLEDLYQTQDYVFFPHIPYAGNTELVVEYGIAASKFDVPNFSVTNENVRVVQESAQATLAIGGLKGLMLSVRGIKYSAHKILLCELILL